MGTLKNILHDIKRSISGKRGLSFWFILAAFALSVATLISYIAMGETSYTPELSDTVTALMCVSMALCLVFAVCEIKVGKYAAYLIGLWAWLEYLISQASYLSSMMVAIDNVALDTGFVLITVFGLLAWVTALVSAIFQKKEISSSDAADEVKAEDKYENV